MKEEELEKHYERRLQTILEEHCKLVKGEERLSPIWKINHLNKVGKMLEAGKQHVYTIEEMDRIEKEMGYKKGGR